MLRPESLALTLLLAALVAAGPLSTDMYLAALPTMKQAFGASVGDVQLTLSVFIIAFAVCQLVIGPLSDRFGRKPVLMIGLAIYGLSSIACALAWSIEALIMFRALQAIGACAGAVIGRAVVRDLYGREGTARAMSYMGTAMGVAPGIAPVIGSYLTVWFGWGASFVFLGLYGFLFLLVVWRLLAESLTTKDHHAIRPGRLAGNYLTLLRHRRYMGYALTCCLCYAGLFSFISAAPFVLIEVFGVAQQHFGYYFAMAVAGYMTGTVVSARLTGRIQPDTALAMGLVVTATAAALMAVLAWAGVDHVVAVMAPMVAYMAGLGIVMPQSQAGALTPFPRMAGTAAAFLGFFQFAFASLVGVAVGQLHDGTQLPMTTAIGIMGVAALCAYTVLVVWPKRTKRS